MCFNKTSCQIGTSASFDCFLLSGEEGLLAVVSPGDCDIEVFDLGDMVTVHGRQAFVTRVLERGRLVVAVFRSDGSHANSLLGDSVCTMLLG